MIPFQAHLKANSTASLCTITKSAVGGKAPPEEYPPKQISWLTMTGTAVWPTLCKKLCEGKNVPPHLTPGTWTHLAFVYCADTSEQRILVNGSLNSSKSDCRPLAGQSLAPAPTLAQSVEGVTLSRDYINAACSVVNLSCTPTKYAYMCLSSPASAVISLTHRWRLSNGLL